MQYKVNGKSIYFTLGTVKEFHNFEICIARQDNRYIISYKPTNSKGWGYKDLQRMNYKREANTPDDLYMILKKLFNNNDLSISEIPENMWGRR